MNQQIKHAVALALAAGAISGAAQASILSSAVTAGNVVLSSGSTAVAAALTNYFDQVLDAAQNPCAISSVAGASSQLEIYTDTGSGQSFVVYACMSNPSVITSSATSVPIAFVKENNAGSANALAPVGSQFASNLLVFPQLSSLSCGSATGKAATAAIVNGGSTTVGGAYSAFACSSVTTVSTSPNMGFADVDPALFGKSAAGYGISIGATVDLVFAPAVSLGLYHALQAAEGITTQDDALADVPNLTKAELTSLFTGQVSDWSFMGASGSTVGSVSVAFGNSGTSALGSYEGKTQAPSSTTVHICRRDDYSGTEKTMETALGGLANNGGSCLAGVNNWVSVGGELTGAGWANSGTSSTVYANNGTGSVLKCLEANDAVGQFAIGYASVDNAWGTNGTPQQGSLSADFRYIKVDGILPSIENAAAGRYGIWAQSVYAIPATSSQANSLSKTGANANALSLQSAITGTHGIGYYRVVEAVNALDQWSSPNFHGGLLAIPSGTSPTYGPNTPVDTGATNTTFFANPVNLYYKTVGGVDTAASPGSVDNCQAATVATINEPNNTPVGGVAGFVPSGN